MKRYWVCLQLRLEAQKDFNLAIVSRQAALSGNASLIVTFSSSIDYDVHYINLLSDSPYWQLYVITIQRLAVNNFSFMLHY